MKVGDRLYPGRTLPEGIAAHGGAGWLVIAALDRPTRDEIAGVSVGAVELAVDVEGPALLWMLRVSLGEQRGLLSLRPRARSRRRLLGQGLPPGEAAHLGWSASAWPWWDRTEPEQPYSSPQIGGIAQVALVHTRTTQVRALRTIGLTHAVASRVRELEAIAHHAGRDGRALEAARHWTLRAPAEAIAARAVDAPARTSVPAKAN